MKINEKNICAFGSTAPYDYEGNLYKRGDINRAFQRRYFALKGNLLFYFEKKGEKQPIGLIVVEGCIIELMEEDELYCFQIAFRDNRTYILSTDSQHNLEGWMKALTCASYEYKLLIMTELQLQLQELRNSQNDKHFPSSEAIVQKSALNRQNPFNRPAPPPPVQTSNSLTHVSLNGCVGTPSIFIREPQIGASNAVRDNLSIISCLAEFGGCLNSKLDFLPCFEQLHERYRQIIMKDILEYQNEKNIINKPLIEL